MPRLWLIFFVALLTGCGFHLRNQYTLPTSMQPLYVSSEPGNSGFYRQLKQSLRQRHIQLTQTPESHYQLILLDTHYGQQTTSVSSNTVFRNNTLTFSARFKLLAPNGQILIPPTTLIHHKKVTVNTNRLLGSNAETQTIHQEMQRQTINQLLRRLARRNPSA